MDIQSSDLKILGIGSAKRDNKKTYFLIVESQKLRKIRMAIHRAFVKKGGDPSDFDPDPVKTRLHPRKA